MKLKIEGKYSASIIGLLFTAIIYISMFTILVPISTLLLPGILEFIFSLFFGDSKYSVIGISVLISLVLLFILTTYSMFKVIFRQKELLKNELFKYFTFQVFIIPPIFFYINTSRNWESASDGQFFFGIYEVFPASSLSFVIIGVIIDIIRFLKNNQVQ